MKKKDKEKVINYIEGIAKGYCYCFSYSNEISKSYMKRFANDRYESSLFRGELVNLHLDILESNGITDTYNGIENESIDTELRKFYTKVFIEEVTKQIEVRKEEEEAKKKAEKVAKEESNGKVATKTKKNSKTKTKK